MTSGYPSHYVNWSVYPGGSPFYGVSALDSGVPYPFGATWAVSGDGTGLDDPQQTVILPSQDNGGTNWYASSAGDEMKTWLMYQPPKVGSMKTVLIPMAQYTWGWGASALRTVSSLTSWTLTSGTPRSATPTKNTVHPAWTCWLPSPFSFGPPQ